MLFPTSFPNKGRMWQSIFVIMSRVQPSIPISGKRSPKRS